MKGENVGCKDKAYELLDEFKGDSYLYGADVLNKVGDIASKQGKKAVLFRGTFPGSDEYVDIIKKSLEDAQVNLVLVEKGAMPNAPREDLERMTNALILLDVDVVISFGGGSTIDAVKAAIVLSVLGGEIEDYFGTGMVSKELEEQGKSLTYHIAIQTVSSSGAHLTKYSNITDIQSGQKKLIVDPAIIPSFPLFDYSVTYNMPGFLTMDGALDGIAHSLEVLYGSHGKSYSETSMEIARECISLVVEYLPKVMSDKNDESARDALCLATDLGAYAIMVGGTNGGHLTSFSLVDILSHGRACAIMNPYYTVFFAPAIENEIRLVGNIFKKYGYSDMDFDEISGRELGEAAAYAMFNFSKKIGFPTTLGEVAGFDDSYIKKALNAAKNPQLKMKLMNMPVPFRADNVDEYMESILAAAKTGDLSLVKNLQS